MRALGAAKLFADRFAIEQEAGAGSLGTVYRAFDRVTKARVALKVLHKQRTPELGRFVTEISVLAGVRHAALIRYLSHGISIDDERFLVSEWLEGESLAQRLHGGKLSPADATLLGYRVASGLAALHEHGVAHGDLKPSNVFLPGGDVAEAKLLDFGLPGGRAESPADAIDDGFALGTLIQSVLSLPAPPVLLSLLARLTAKLPEDRPKSLAEVRDALGRMLDDAAAVGAEQDEAKAPPKIDALGVRPTGEADEAWDPPSSEVPPTLFSGESAVAPSVRGGTRYVRSVPPRQEEKEEPPKPLPPIELDPVLRSGRTFAGRYLLEARVGVGGMGELFRAFDTRLRRAVALKVLHRERTLFAPSESSARILREARAAAALSHANVVAIHDVGEHDGLPFIAMEYVEGQSLRAFVGTKTPPFETRLGWMIDVARALGAAHEKGLVHRDIKPDNVMIRDDGAVKVLDFGIARYREGPPEHTLTADETSDLGAAHAAIAQSTLVVGTPGYMSPEQMRGDRIDGRADQFSWGVVAFEVFSGTMPWQVKTGSLSVAAAVLSETPRDFGDDVPAKVAAVVRRALSKSARDRFPTMRDLVSALGGAADTPSKPATLEGVAGGGMPMTGNDGDGEVPLKAPPPPWLSGGRSTALVGTLVALMVATVMAGRTLVRGEAHTIPLEAAPSASPSGTSVASLPPPSRCNAVAAAHYRQGISAMREANWEAAETEFSRAVEADPSCPEALLRRMMVSESAVAMITRREYFRLAAEQRDALSERDRVLFDAYLPLVILEPPDREVAARVLEKGLDRFPRDAELLLTAANVRLGLLLDDAALMRALDLATRATDIDPTYADAWQTQGRILSRLGRTEDALAAMEACLRVSPSSSDCTQDHLFALRIAGRCDQIVPEARKWIALAPSSGAAYWTLALGLADEGAPDEAVEESLRQELLHQPEEGHRRSRWLEQSADLAAFHGDFEKAEALASDAARESADETALLWHLRPAMLLLDIAEETGRFDRASAVAEQFLQRSSAWTVGAPLPEFLSYEPVMLAAMLRQRRISLDTWRADTTLWQNRVSRWIPKMDAWSFLWGPVSEMGTLAAEAMTVMPVPDREIRPVNGGFSLLAADIQRGRVLHAAGYDAQAIEPLERGAKRCLSFERPFEGTRANLWLAEVRERTGDKAGACRAYNVVVSRWGNAKPSSRSADEARKRLRALGCTQSQ